MGKLILSIDGVAVKEFILTAERTTIGRKATSSIQIDNLAVSGEHAVVTSLMNDSFIEDLNSTNGTFVNAKPIRRHLLHDGDIVEIGKHKLKFVQDNKDSSHANDYERTTAVRTASRFPEASEVAAPLLDIEEIRRSFVKSPDSTVVQAPDALNSVEKMDEAIPLGLVQVLNSPIAGRVLNLSKELTTLGKTGGDVAVIARRSNGYFLTSVDGNEPLVNGAALNGQARLLCDHDIIQLAGVKLEFYFKS